MYKFKLVGWFVMLNTHSYKLFSEFSFSQRWIRAALFLKLPGSILQISFSWRYKYRKFNVPEWIMEILFFARFRLIRAVCSLKLSGSIVSISLLARAGSGPT